MGDLLLGGLKNNNGQHYPRKAWLEEDTEESKTKQKYVTFQDSMKVPLIIGQCFGLIPVLGITKNDPSKLKFTFLSWKFFYTMLTISGQVIFVLFCFMKLIKDSDALFSANTSIIFYTSNCLTTILFLRLAAKWPRLSQQIARLEVSDPITDNSLPRKCKIACFTILALAIVEHLLYTLNDISEILECSTDRSVYETFILKKFPWIFHFVPYNDFTALLAQIVNIQCTFNWNFADVFVICISLYLTAKLDQVNKTILTAKGKYVPSTFWRDRREEYCRASSLVKKVDDVIGGIIFLSFANNLFFICLQLLHTLVEGVKAKASCKLLSERPLRGYEQAVYFIYSFTFLVVRATAGLLMAARIHTASKVPARALYRVSSSAYYVEVKRFLDQINADSVALSGIQFFKVKRGLVLTIAGTIVTYELVLMQFAGVTPA